ncbi:hypothetical protein UB37_00530 [Photobacterium iliopiscarium]|uniref:hypothetical protein n=1 Tax=Photobacterium iliopiscarium TaxID=56192 RepID=UPI0005D32C55|nr:hypothetical protein [Photobacterium iliopiscarium]KJG26766.1 hypothetical protein UB37_00530 [Photobacterium iliopiscarium]
MFNKVVEDSLNEAKAARAELSKHPAIFVGEKGKNDGGLYLSNYANCLLNRQIDIFDDSILLLENDRVASACTISRGMIETYSFAKLLADKISKILTNSEGPESVEKALDVLMGFTNSSRYKQTEQKKTGQGNH